MIEDAIISPLLGEELLGIDCIPQSHKVKPKPQCDSFWTGGHLGGNRVREIMRVGGVLV